MKKIYLFFLIIISVMGHAQNCFWARSVGGPNDQSGVSMTVDGAGNSYTTGFFRGIIDLDPGPGVYTINSPAYTTFVTKLDAQGNFVWAKQIGRAINNYGQSYPHSIVLDGTGNFFISGNFQDSCDFDPGSGLAVLSASVTSGPNYYAYVCKFDTAGNLMWAGKMGGTGTTQAMDLAIDFQGSVCITGSFNGTADFDPDTTVHTITTSSPGSSDIFLCKLNSSGKLRWVQSFGGSGSDDGWSLTVDANGGVYSTGRFQNTVDFDPGSGTTSVISKGGDDVFICKFDSAGNFKWVKQLGETGDEMGSSIALDASCNVYTTGLFHGTMDMDPGSGTSNHTSVAAEDIFASKLDSAGNFVWGKSFGGSSDDDASNISVDANKNVYISGDYRNTVDFNPGAGTFTITSVGDVDVFINKLDSMGNFIWAKSIGGPNTDMTQGGAVDGNMNVYTTGYFTTWADFDPYAGIDSLAANGTYDVFISKIEDPLSANFSSINNVSCYGGHDGSATVSAHGGTLPYTYSWNTTPMQTSATATGLYAGVDTVTITENHSCYLKLAVALTQPPADSAKICMVTVDSLSQNNIIIWDKTVYTDVDSFIIYREVSTNNYKRLGAVSSDSLSQFIDTARNVGPANGDPNTGTYRYKLKTLSSCGIYSAVSPYHNTIYFLNSGATFFWTQLYSIEGGSNPVNNYVLMRDNLSNGNWQIVTSVAGSQQTVNDPLYSIYQNTASWRVQTEWNISCTPTLRTASSNGVALNGSSSYSNIISNNPNAIKTVPDLTFAFYPNPSNGKITLEYAGYGKASVEIYDMLGSKVFSQNNLPLNQANLDLGSMESGVYFLNLKSEKGAVIRKITIQ